MVCYIIPSSLALMLFVFRRFKVKKDKPLYLLNLLLAAGSIMLIIDHLWNNELFLISTNIFHDIILGFLMTIGTIIFWHLILVTEKQKSITLNQNISNKQ